MSADDDGYTIEEIRDATKGFFGTISTNLAAVLEHAFKTTGRPTGYVLGKEGGGAFLAGLRYGDGTLYMRHQSDQRQVYWHGPSVGYDVGAEGGRTLFLIYRLSDPSGLYRSFTGAYPYGEVEPFSRPRFNRPPVALLSYRPDLPAWLDQVLQRSIAVRPEDRYEDIIELIFAIEHGALSGAPTPPRRLPLLERDPLRFWQIVSALLALTLVLALTWR